jgi:DNA-binding response OmpR family regulator
VLIVEDDKAIYTACHTLLKHYQFDVMLATTLAAATHSLAAKPDLVILDLSLPDGNGAALLEKIRSSGQQVKVFILTGDETKETERKLRRLMPDRFFHKPLNFIEILEAARETLSPPTPAGHSSSLLDSKKPAA